MDSMLELRDGPEGATLKIKVKPKANQNAILGVRGDALLIAVTAAPEQGKANRACIDLLARALKIPKSDIKIIAGETHPEKIVHLRGLTAAQMRERLRA